ncbi:MAG: OmpA family protein [Candidatus Rokubacteria bacterium]|nr:OmpA family protein [Candidatus Rokubacteria bacterium]
MRLRFRIGVLAPAMLLLASGCATKDWVRELLGTKEVEIDQRMGQQAQRVEGMGFRVQSLETSVGEVGELVRGAGGRADAAYGRADAAYARADEVDSRLTRLWSNRHARDLVETLHVQFGFDRWDLNDGAQTALLSLVKELRENPKLVVDLEGYTDSVGPREYNVQLSQRRVEVVRRYLVEKGVGLPRIHWIGLGQLPDRGTPEEQAKNRRVTLRLLLPKD